MMVDEMKHKKSTILEFQYKNIIVIEDYFPFKLVLEDSERKNIFNTCKQEAENLLFKNTFEQLSQDVFFSFYNKSLEVRPIDFIELRFLLNHLIIENLLKEDSHKNFRSGQFSTVHNKVASYQAYIVFINKIFDNIKKYLTEDEQKEFDRLIDKSQALKEKQDSLKKDNTVNDNEKKELSENINDDESQIKKDIQTFINKIKDKFIKIVHDSLDNAQKEISETDNTLGKMLGGPFRGYEKGELQKIPIHQRIELAKKLRNIKKLQNLVDYIGKFRIIAYQKQIEKLSSVPQEIADVKKGDNLENILPEELLKLNGNEATRVDFIQRWSKEDLLEFERKPKREKENLGKGSIIICIDTSGSMAGEKEYKSKALALSIADVAYAQKRNFACILFSSKWEVEVIKIHYKETLDTTSQKVINIAANFYGGGTDFESPLRKALDIINEDEFNNGDIIFLTDGYANVSENFLKEYKKLKNDKQLKTIGLLCDSRDSDRENGKKILSKFCDEIKFNSEIQRDTEFQHAEDFASELFLNL